MRQVDPKIIEERKNRVLQVVIHHFIKTGRPVSSSILTEDYDFDLSSATLRNLMSGLENEGFLTHPHTSAGRIPTDRGYRSYVDSLIELQKLVIDEEKRVRQEYDTRLKELEEVLVQTSKVLSALSQYSGFVMTPKLDSNQLEHIELLHLSENRVLVILVTHSGMVRHKVIEASIPGERLAYLTNRLNNRLKGLSFGEAKKRILQELEETERLEKEFFGFVKNISQEIFSVEEEIYLDGAANVLNLPEFHDYEPVRCLLRLNEDKDILMHILEEKRHSGDGVEVIIGSETSCEEFKNLSVVSSVYKDGESPIGVLGIIGPKRMEYPKMMALVSAVSKIVNKILSK